MPIVWHPKRWWNFCISEDEKKLVIKITVSILYVNNIYWEMSDQFDT